MQVGTILLIINSSEIIEQLHFKLLIEIKSKKKIKEQVIMETL